MSTQPLFILSGSAGRKWINEEGNWEGLALAAEAGFDALLAPEGFSLFGSDPAALEAFVTACRGVGIRPMIGLDLTRFPLDHPLVADNPDFFAVRRSGNSEKPVDPREPAPSEGVALARLRNPVAGAVLNDAIGRQLAQLAKLGIGGFRFDRPEHVGSAALTAILAGLRGDDVLTVAGPFGMDLAGGAALVGAGLDFAVSSFGWWDLRAPWLAEEARELARAGPLLAELRDDQPIADEDENGLERLLLAAAVSATGMIVPEAFLARSARAQNIAARAIAAARQAVRHGPLARQLSEASDPVTVLLRTIARDLRALDSALLALINVTDALQPLPEPGVLIQRAGAPIILPGTDLGPLAPGDIRLLEITRAKPIVQSAPAAKQTVVAGAQAPRLVIEGVAPRVEGGNFAVKRVVGDPVPVSATIFTDGHEQLAAELRWRALDEAKWTAVRMAAAPNDLWTAQFTLERLGAHEFVIEAWLDPYGGFRRDFATKRDAGVAQSVDHAEGRALIEQAAAREKGKTRTALKAWLTRIDKADDDAQSAAALLDPELAALMDAACARPHRLTGTPQRIDAERLAARFSSWYELFPRSMAPAEGSHGTFTDVIDHLPRIRDMGFDTLYFPPIHPIGATNRKGPNNTLTPEPHDVGSPYAIGSADGGHDALHPELGSFEDFGRLIAAARDQGMEIALDFAIQCSPDHPWLTQHPGWFAWRSDGTMKYAENPPKKYQDIVNVDFYGPDAVPDLWIALRDVILHWIEHGVTTFRVDNPHTKPLPFWEWMIADVRARHPEAIFLAEAFTRPAMMYRLAKIGFSQSYTYFTWRDSKAELTEYFTELTTAAPKEFFRPHLFVNTPDINPVYLQTSGRPGFRIRAVLAATLSGLFGVYSGFELCESAPIPGKEEYLDSEKYIIKPRDWQAPGNIIEDITRLNLLRRRHAALQTHLNTRFYTCTNEHIIYYGKPSADGREIILVLVNLDPHHGQDGTYEVPLWELGLSDEGAVAVEDLIHGNRFTLYGKLQHINLAPDEPYRIWRIAPQEAHS